MKRSLSNLMMLITILFMDFLTGMEFDLFVPSFPELKNQFGLTPFWVEALLSANFLGYCLSLIFIGDLSDRYGRKLMVITGLIIFVLGSILCLWPPSYVFLLIGRFLQGVGIAAPAILSFLIIADSYPIREQQFLMAMLNGSLNIAAGLAPVIGSYITLYFSWQGNFATLLAMGIIVLLMTMIFIPVDKKQAHSQSTHIGGLHGYLELLKSKPLILLITSLLFLFAPFWIFVGMSPLLYIEDLGVSLSHFGYYQGLFAVVFAFGSITIGLMMKHIEINQKKMLNANNILILISIFTIGLASLSGTTNPLYITLAFLIFIIGQIIPSIILYPICLNYIPHAKGRISAVLQGAKLILTAIGLQVAGFFYDGSFKNIGIILVCFILVSVITLHRSRDQVLSTSPPTN